VDTQTDIAHTLRKNLTHLNTEIKVSNVAKAIGYGNAYAGFNVHWPKQGNIIVRVYSQNYIHIELHGPIAAILNGRHNFNQAHKASLFLHKLVMRDYVGAEAATR